MSDPTTDRFRVTTGEHLGRQVIALADWSTQTQAILVPEYGFPCIAFRLRTADGPWHVVAEPPDAESFATRVGRYGIPLMYPWPNRIRDGTFSFEGREYTMPVGGRGPHAIHGITRERTWTVDASGADERGAFCRAHVRTAESPDDVWPFQSELSFEYRLRGRTLGMRAVATNLGSSPMPMGFGIHPWFDVPFGSSTTRDEMEIRANAGAYWDLDETLCTTGAVRPATEGIDLRDWSPIAGRFIDDVYTDLQLAGGWFTAEVRDPANGRTIAVRSDAAFREHVVFAPLHSAVVCLEPYTCTTDAFNLTAKGLDAGTLVLAPGQTWSGEMEIEARN
jgi:aldose 1-epimerase